MIDRKRLVAMLVAAVVVAASGAPYTFTVDSVDAQVKRAGSVEWVRVSGSGTVDFGDSLLVPSPGSATLVLDSQTTLLMKDSCKIVLSNADSLVAVDLLSGQVFLSREGDGGRPFRIRAGSCTFIPVGTAAAVKLSPKGEPRVAVLRGKVRMSAPDGASQEVGPGFFGTFDPSSGTLGMKELPPAAIQALEDWSAQARKDATAAADASDAGGVPETTGADDSEGEAVEVPVEAAQAVPEDPAAPAGQSAQAAAAPEPPAAPAPADSAKAADARANAEAIAAEVKQKSDERKVDEEKGQKEDGAGKGAAKKPAGVVDGEAAKDGGEGEEQKADREKDKPKWEIVAGTVTVDGEQWTRIAFSVDVPIWRFGVCFDLELFLDAQGQFSDKGWSFTKERWPEAVSRKIRYIRFNHEDDPVFVRFMGLENVTFGYGFVVDRFTNMLNYPDDKLLGLQFYLNDLTPVGLTLQTMVADFLDFRNDGGLLAGRFALKPLKPSGVPIVKGIDIGVTYATDLNQFAPAREWDFALSGSSMDRDEDGIPDGDWQDDNFTAITGDTLSTAERVRAISLGRYDTFVEHRDRWAERAEDRFSVLGFDMGVPIISGKVLGLDVYAHAGISLDNTDDDDTAAAEGWGIGAPGVALRAGPFWARAEYRHLVGEFEPGYFGPYYFAERLSRNPIVTRESTLGTGTRNGIYGSAGFNIADILLVSATYQRLGKGTDPRLDQRFEATAGIGEVLLGKIPKLNKAEIYLYKSKIQRTVVDFARSSDGTIFWDQPYYDQLFFEQTPNTFWGYRLGAEVMPGASIIWDTRYGWELDGRGKLVENNSVTLSAGLSF